MDVNEVLQKSLIMREVRIQIPMPAGAAVPAQAPQAPGQLKARQAPSLVPTLQLNRQTKN